MQVDNEPSGAVFTANRTHRLYLWRRWNWDLPWLMLIGLNPSTADERRNDPTVRRGIGFGYRWGYGGLFMCNAYTLASTDPKKLNTENPLDIAAPLAMRIIRAHCKEAIACWGNQIELVRGWEDRVDRIKNDLSPLHCLGMTKQGHPRHPLYLPYSTRLESLEG